MVFNDKLRNELLKYTPRYMRMHDVWIYDVAMALVHGFVLMISLIFYIANILEMRLDK